VTSVIPAKPPEAHDSFEIPDDGDRHKKPWNEYEQIRSLNRRAETETDKEPAMIRTATSIPRNHQQTVRLLASTALFTLASWTGVEMIRPGELTPFWLANGVTLAILTITPRKQWPVYLLGGAAGNIVTHLVHGYALLPSVQTTFANTIEILIAGWPFRKTAPHHPDLTQGSTLLRFALFGGLLGPLASGLWITFTTTHLVDYYSLAIRFRLWFVGDSLGMVLVTPFMLALLDTRLKEIFTGWRMVETLALLSLPFAAAVFAFHSRQYSFPFIVLVPLIPVIFRLGLAGSAIAVLLISLPAIHYTFLNRGPFVWWGPLYSSFFLQVYFAMLLAVTYVLSAVRAQEERLADELRKSESRYRVLAETSQDIILRTTMGGVRTYISPSVQQVIGWTEAELPPPANFALLVHPADRRHFADFLTRLSAAPGSHTLTFRIRKRDGAFGWLEACVGTVFNKHSVPEETVWTIRDISLRVAHEESLRIEKRQAEELAWTDSLTELNNRRAFDEKFAAEWQFAGEHGTALSLLMLDVDHFKSYNDTYGHLCGDEALRRIARVIGECTRQSRDLAARYGGEEFAVVLPYADATRASEVAERIRESVFDLRLAHAKSPSGIVTVSVGVASTRHAVGGDSNVLIEQADRALYDAKRLGRNRIMLAASGVRAIAAPASHFSLPLPLE
jgi:diguanylate cyclase (GGDEF)-like protein/PAS domain S-box-containing protein